MGNSQPKENPIIGEDLERRLKKAETSLFNTQYPDKDVQFRILERRVDSLELNFEKNKVTFEQRLSHLNRTSILQSERIKALNLHLQKVVNVLKENDLINDDDVLIADSGNDTQEESAN